MKKSRRNSFLLPIGVALIVCISIAVTVWLKVDVSKKKTQLEELQEQVSVLSQENEDINYLINEADEAELYEHLARERGYVYPDEKVYYDVTPGN